MAKAYRKELPKTPLHFSVGRAVPFESIDDDYGYYATDNGWEIAELDRAVASRTGGVTEITMAEYESWLKKKASAPPRSTLPRRRQSIGPLPRRSAQASLLGAGPAGISNVMGVTQGGTPVSGIVHPQRAEGLKVDREFVKPKAGRIPTQPSNAA